MNKVEYKKRRDIFLALLWGDLEVLPSEMGTWDDSAGTECSSCVATEIDQLSQNPGLTMFPR